VNAPPFGSKQMPFGTSPFENSVDARDQTTPAHVGKSKPHGYGDRPSSVATYSNCAPVGSAPPALLQNGIASVASRPFTGKFSYGPGDVVNVHQSAADTPV